MTDCVQTGKNPVGLGRLLIVDGHSFAYRAFYAIRKLNAPDGRPTNAIYGFIRMLGKIRALVKPTHLAVLWDGGLAEERLALLPQYKAQRKEMPGDLEVQLDEILAFLAASETFSWSGERVEADDCIAALTKEAVNAGLEVVIASSDKDFMQLVSGQTRLLGPSGNVDSFLDVAGVIGKTGVNPSQIVDWLSLIGDSVDNIPGVKGVGPKTASKLLQQFGSIENLYAQLSEVGSALLRANLNDSRELVQRNQKLVQLNVNVACELRLEAMKLSSNTNMTALRKLFDLWGFHSMSRELEKDQLKTGDFFDE